MSGYQKCSCGYEARNEKDLDDHTLAMVMCGEGFEKHHATHQGDTQR